MRTIRPLLAATVSGMLAGSLLSVTPAAADPPEPGVHIAPDAVSVSPADPSRAVTLITGDRVVVTGEGDLVIDRAAGREDVTFLASRSDDHRYVIPSDALDLVRQGRLDRRLFDITRLREYGYDDRRSDLPLIITGGDPQATLAALPAGAEVSRQLPVVDGAALRWDKADAASAWEQLTDPAGEARVLRGGFDRVLLDGLHQPLLSESVPQVGAPAAWDLGLDGSGVTVAVLDTGLDANHPDLSDQIVGSRNFTEGEEDDRDLVGHGTHVASIVAGTGAAADGEFTGVAPGAQLLDGKVCVEYGCAESWILAGMQWAAEQGADVVNMSLGGSATPEPDPLEQAVQTLTDEYGVLFVISAGNSGADQSIGSPGTAEAALTVGAVDKDDELASFSSRGPLLDGSLKPDLTAPGVEIVAANSEDGFLGEPGEAYTTLSGTSMSSPHAAGAAAILRQQHPDWGPAQVKATLMGAASPHPELGPYAQGAGRLDVARAVEQSVTTDPPSVSFTRTEWPHEDDEPQTRTVTYRNHGGTDVELDLELRTHGPAGGPAPEGFFTLDAASVTVPAGGEAEVALTTDTSVGGQDGYFGGQLVATGSDAAVSTAFAVDREPESYDVTLTHTDREGTPTTSYLTSLVRLDSSEWVDVSGSDSEATVRLEAGDYTLMSFVGSEAAGEYSTTLLAQPELTVDRERTIALDARRGEPISVTVPEPAAAPTLATVGAQITTEYQSFGFAVLGQDFAHVFSGQLGDGGAVNGFLSTVRGSFAEPTPDGGFDDPTYTYDLFWYQEDEMITGFTREVGPDQLATVEAEHAAHVQGAVGLKRSFAVPPVPYQGASAVSIPTELPFHRTEYYNTDGGVTWRTLLDEELPGDDGFPETITSAESPVTAYEAGRTYQQEWNYAVFGPAFVTDLPTLSRSGDRLDLLPLLYGDRTGRPVVTWASGDISVFRDGEQIAEVPELTASVEVPPESAEYRVEVDAERDERYPLSTATTVAWEFTSGPVGEEPRPLPVSVVRFAPDLDLRNTAPAGWPALVPVEVTGQPGSDAARVKQLTVEVSYDDGDSWRPAPVLPWFGGKRVLLWPPRGADFVSLRAGAVDRDGNTVEQTIIRAYQLG